MENYDYVIVGGGLAGASAIKGIREKDRKGSILLIGDERYLPYNRPPLSKDLLLGDDTLKDVYVQDEGFYQENKVEVKLGTEVTNVDPDKKRIRGDDGGSYGYGKLLLATGGSPKKLEIPGGGLEGVIYYRRLEDYKDLDDKIQDASSAVILGGGFIGAELAAALNKNSLDVEVVFPDKLLLEKIFPEELASAVQEEYKTRGVEIYNEDVPERITREGERYEVLTREGKILNADLVLAGIGIKPNVELCEGGNFDVFEGIEVDEHLETSCEDVYAAGDNAYFPFAVLEDCIRVEHWDNAINQGKLAGKNMAGAGEPYDYIPYFYSDLFDLGFEALGDVDANLETFIDWKKEGGRGVVYYLSEDGRVRGVLLLGVWGKKGEARRLLKRKECFKKEDLVGEIG